MRIFGGRQAGFWKAGAEGLPLLQSWLVSALSFDQARALILERVKRAEPVVERVGLDGVVGRVLADDILADRDYPPVARSVRDGYAVRAKDLPGELDIIGEVRAGEAAAMEVGPRQAVEIMTGAPVPEGADCVVMVEHTTREGNRMRTERTQQPGDAINPRGAEARAGSLVIPRGARVTSLRVAMLATIGCCEVPVYRRPTVAILPTGDEVVSVEATPEPYQVRNSNAYSVAAQVRRAGGEARLLPVAPDRADETRRLMEAGLQSDLLLLSGGVSAGKYDIVEQVLAELGAEFYFTRVKIQPGQPLVFGSVRGKFFFGLPGNPASTIVTFETLARAALERLAGTEPELPLLHARLTREFRHRTGLTRFLPALVDPAGYRVTPVPWQGSSDVAALARSNAFLVADSGRESWAEGDLIPVLLQ